MLTLEQCSRKASFLWQLRPGETWKKKKRKEKKSTLKRYTPEFVKFVKFWSRTSTSLEKSNHCADRARHLTLLTLSVMSEDID